MLADKIGAGQRYQKAMERALQLAARGPECSINPQVGCVVLDAAGNIIAEGWHNGAGTPHAETAALAQLRAGDKPETVVVTMEPCNHYGLTPPCSKALIAAGIKTVVYGSADPGLRSGGGAYTLRDAGVAVHAGVLQAATDRLVQAWQKRAKAAASVPRVIAKWAQSIDGRAYAADGSSRWITGSEARADVHLRRAAADAIGIGSGTLITDDPALTARDTDGNLLVAATAQPIPVVFGKTEIPVAAKIWEHPALTARAAIGSQAQLSGLPEGQASGGAVGRADPLKYSGDNLAAALQDLGRHGIKSLFLEGGPALISSFLRAGLVDEVLIYQSFKLLGGNGCAVQNIGVQNIGGAVKLAVIEQKMLGNDLLVHAKIRKNREEKIAGMG